MTREDIEKKMHESAEEIKPLVTTLVEALCEAHQKGYLAGVELGAKMAYPHWIPVEERLPEPGKDVLVWSSGFDEPMVGCFKHWNWQRKQHMFYVHNDRNMWGNITHWMPLPQLPGKED